MFGYTEIYSGEKPEDPLAALRKRNQENLEKSIYNAEEAEEVQQIYINDPMQQVRQPTPRYPAFKNAGPYLNKIRPYIANEKKKEQEEKEKKKKEEEEAKAKAKEEGTGESKQEEKPAEQ